MIVGLLAGGFWDVGAGPTRPFVYSSFERWSTQDGLPQNSVQALHQSKDGFLWIGTREGVLRYDGFRFVHLNEFSDAFLVHDIGVLSIEEAVDGRIYFVHHDGVVCLDGGAFSRVPLPVELDGARIRAFCPSRLDGYYLATERHLHFFTAGPEPDLQWTILTGTTSANDLQIMPDSSLLYATYSGVYRYREGQAKLELLYSIANGLKSNFVSNVFLDQRNRLWLSVVKNKQWGGITEMVKGEDGLHVIEGDTIYDVDLPAAVASAQISCILVDREGNRWLGTRYDGLYRFSPPLMHTLTAAEGLGSELVRSVSVGASNRIWVGTRDGVFLRQGTAPFRRVFGDYEYLWEGRNATVNAVFESTDGQLWVGTENGVFRGWNDRFERVDPQPGLRGLIEVLVIEQGPADTVFVGTSKDLIWFDTNLAQVIQQDVDEREIRCLDWSPDGFLWVGASDGLYRFRDGEFYPVTEWNYESGMEIHSVLEESSNRLWIGTSDGLWRLAEGQLSRLGAADGLLEADVADIQLDDHGNLWLAGEQGIKRVSLTDTNRFLDGQSETLDVVAYGESYGMRSSHVARYGKPSSWKDAEGRLYYSTLRGLVVFDPVDLLRAEKRPNVVIESVRAGRQTLYGSSGTNEIVEQLDSNTVREHFPSSTPGKLVVPTGSSRTVEVHYTVTSFLAPESVQFRCRLEGYDDEWRDVGQRKLATYTNLGPGEYRFRVIAANNLGLWNRVGAAVEIEIVPFFYETKLFYGFCGSAVMGFALFVHFLRMRFQRQGLLIEQQTAIADDRARIAKDMHDQMGANLTQIAMLGTLASEQATPEWRTKEVLSRMVDKAQSVSASMKELVWATNPRNDSVEGLLAHASQFSADFLSSAQIRCRLDLPEQFPRHELSGFVRNHLFLAIKEALNNAVKHAEATEIWLRCKIEGRKLEIQVEDNGIGISRPELKTSDGNGLENMRRRLALCGGEMRVKPSSGTGCTIIFVCNIALGPGDQGTDLDTS